MHLCNMAYANFNRALALICRFILNLLYIILAYKIRIGIKQCTCINRQMTLNNAVVWYIRIFIIMLFIKMKENITIYMYAKRQYMYILRIRKLLVDCQLACRELVVDLKMQKVDLMELVMSYDENKRTDFKTV